MRINWSIPSLPARMMFVVMSGLADAESLYDEYKALLLRYHTHLEWIAEHIPENLPGLPEENAVTESKVYNVLCRLHRKLKESPDNLDVFHGTNYSTLVFLRKDWIYLDLSPYPKCDWRDRGALREFLDTQPGGRLIPVNTKSKLDKLRALRPMQWVIRHCPIGTAVGQETGEMVFPSCYLDDDRNLAEDPDADISDDPTSLCGPGVAPGLKLAIEFLGLAFFLTPAVAEPTTKRA